MRMVEADGWKHVRTTGSHPHYKHDNKAASLQYRAIRAMTCLRERSRRYVSSGTGKEAMSLTYAVIFEQGESNWAAYVPDLPGCMTTGASLEETERNIREAIEGHLRTLRDFGDPIPRPTSVANTVEVSSAA